MVILNTKREEKYSHYYRSNNSYCCCCWNNNLFPKKNGYVFENVSRKNLIGMVSESGTVTTSGVPLFGTFFNTSVNIPLETMQHQVTGVNEIVEIDIEVNNISYINETMDEVELVLKNRRKIAADKKMILLSIWLGLLLPLLFPHRLVFYLACIQPKKPPNFTLLML